MILKPKIEAVKYLGLTKRYDRQQGHNEGYDNLDPVFLPEFGSLIPNFFDIVYTRFQNFQQ